MAQSVENTRLKKETEILITVPLAPVDAASGKTAPADSDKAMYKNGRSDQYARGMAGLLAAKTGCRVFPASRIQRRDRNGSAERGYGEFIAQLAPKAVIELSAGVPAGKADTIEICAGGRWRNFLEKLSLYTFQYECRELQEISAQIIPEASGMRMPQASAGSRDSAEASDGKGNSWLRILISENLCNDRKTAGYHAVFSSLKAIVSLLMNFDWEADKAGVYRLFQANAKSQIPQDKIEFASPANGTFAENSFVHLCTPSRVRSGTRAGGGYRNPGAGTKGSQTCAQGGAHETARVNGEGKNTAAELEEFIRNRGGYPAGEYVILTNRLIQLLFGREWIEGKEEFPGLACAPVVVYQNNSDRYEIGIPKADKVDRISLSSELFREKFALSSKYDYLVFNRFSDSRIFLDVEKSDYQDFGRVKDKAGNPNAKKVMMPRYYRLMMGYLDKPFKTVRAEEYRTILQDISRDASDNAVQDGTQETLQGGKQNISADDFRRCYEKMPGQAYYQLIEEDSVPEEDRKAYSASKLRVTKYLESIGAYSSVDLIREPKRAKPKGSFFSRRRGFRKKLWLKILGKAIGYSEYILKTSWAGETDDKNSVARLNSNMMSLLGVSENDKILIRFGDSTITLRVLPKDDLTDYEIGIPSSGRLALKMNSINDIVTVHRDMEYAFKRHSQEQTIAILGTVLAVAQVLTVFPVFTSSWKGVAAAIAVCVIAIALMLYFALSEERVKVK